MSRLRMAVKALHWCSCMEDIKWFHLYWSSSGFISACTPWRKWCQLTYTPRLYMRIHMYNYSGLSVYTANRLIWIDMDIHIFISSKRWTNSIRQSKVRGWRHGRLYTWMNIRMHSRKTILRPKVLQDIARCRRSFWMMSSHLIYKYHTDWPTVVEEPFDAKLVYTICFHGLEDCSFIL